jgi:tripartite-type tricarboxylate transporter receptor subunit TctC
MCHNDWRKYSFRVAMVALQSVIAFGFRVRYFRIFWVPKSGCEMTKRALLVLALAASYLGLLPTGVRAQDYPTRTIRLIVPFPAGGGVDFAARLVGQKLGEALGQQLIIENRVGASGTVGALAAARATPDGYTLMFCAGDILTVPALMPRMGFDPTKDFAPITMISSSPVMVVANLSSPFNNINELIQVARASPVSLGYATPGAGNINQLAGEWIAMAANIKLLNIPYRSGPAAMSGVVAGDVPIAITSPPPAQGLVESGQVKLIGLTSKRPSHMPPSWPTLAESGLPIDLTLWLGLFAPAGTPEPILVQIDKEMRKILQDEDVRKRMHSSGTEPESVSLGAFADRIRADTARYDDIIKKTGIRVER